MSCFGHAKYFISGQLIQNETKKYKHFTPFKVLASVTSHFELILPTVLQFIVFSPVYNWTISMNGVGRFMGPIWCETQYCFKKGFSSNLNVPNVLPKRPKINFVFMLQSSYSTSNVPPWLPMVWTTSETSLN